MTGSGSNLVIVYHRQPYEEVVENGKTVYRENKSPNGIVPTLKSFFGSVDRGSWVAWKQVSAKKQERFERQVEITDSYGSYTVSRLPLTADQVKKFYHVTSKEALWPILHSFPWLFRYDNADWENFREVNWLFAEAACREAADDALIWIHDYNLWLCPGYIRQMKPDAKIAFFHHTPFPAADVFNILPWREEIVDSLLTCDMIGFHIPRYTQNFVGVARSLRPVTVSREVPVETSSKPLGMALSEPTVAVGLSTGEREIVLDSWPVGTNPAFIDCLLSTDDAKQQVADIGNEITEQKLICSVGRVDYTKGTKEMLLTFERLLERNPAIRGKVKLLCVAVAAASGMKIYKSEQAAVEQIVGRINGRFSTLGWGPIKLFTTPVPFKELVAYFRAADVCWITPLRDGLNLVAKEYVATRKGHGGALVLSEFTGVATELPEAIMTNPYSARNMDAAIDQALSMPEEEQKSRIAAMYETVRTYDIDHWANHVFSQFSKIEGVRMRGTDALKGEG